MCARHLSSQILICVCYSVKCTKLVHSSNVQSSAQIRWRSGLVSVTICLLSGYDVSNDRGDKVYRTLVSIYLVLEWPYRLLMEHRGTILVRLRLLPPGAPTSRQPFHINNLVMADKWKYQRHANLNGNETQAWILEKSACSENTIIRDFGSSLVENFWCTCACLTPVVSYFWQEWRLSFRFLRRNS